MLNNYVSSLIRTWVPIGVGILMSWVALKFDLIVDDGTASGMIAMFTGILTAVWYAIVRWAEQRFPQLGWLLGLPKQPGYSEETPPPPQPAPVDEGGYSEQGLLTVVLLGAIVVILLIALF